MSTVPAGVSDRARRAAALAALLVATSLGFACERRTDRASSRGGSRAEAGSAALAGEVAALRTAYGNATKSGLEARGAAGRRLLSPGDRVGAGSRLACSQGTSATIRLSDGTSLALGESSSASIEGNGDGRCIRVLSGNVQLSRRRGSAGELAVELGSSGARFLLSTGRLVTSWSEGSGGGVHVESGAVRRPGGGGWIAAGTSLRVDNDGRISEDSLFSSAAAPSRGWIEPLAPASIPAASVPDVRRGIGTLTARVPGSGRKNETALELVEHSVDVTIRDGVAHTLVEEVFANRSGRRVEGTYRFPLPSGASIANLELEIDGELEQGEVLEKKRAARIFRRVVEDSVRPRDPALLEWEHGSTFTMKIFPIRPRESRRVRISYMQPLTARNGLLRYTYPLEADGARVGSFSFGADIASPLGLRDVRTPLYPAEINAEENRAAVRFEASDYTPGVDLVVEFARRRVPGEARVSTQTESNGQTYAMALLRPRIEHPSPGAARRVVIVSDTSYGVAPEVRALQASTAVELLSALGPEDRFQLLACDSGCRRMSPGFSPISPGSLERAHSFLSGVEPGGASDLLGALQGAFAAARGERGASVVYIGDAVPTAGVTDPEELLGLLSETRPEGVSLHAIGAGPDVDSALLDALARRLGGSSHVLSVGESPAAAALSAASGILSPALTNVTLEWPRGFTDPVPRWLGRIPAGTEVAAFARLSGKRADGELVLRGTAPDGSAVERSFRVDVRPDEEGSSGFVGRLWAKRQMERMILRGAEPDEIVSLSRRMRVACRLTSWIVLENEKMYERFGVQRTIADEWSGLGAEFAEAAEVDEEESPEDLFGPDLDDELDALATSASGKAAPAGAGGGGKGAPFASKEGSSGRSGGSTERARRTEAESRASSAGGADRLAAAAGDGIAKQKQSPLSTGSSPAGGPIASEDREAERKPSLSGGSLGTGTVAERPAYSQPDRRCEMRPRWEVSIARPFPSGERVRRRMEKLRSAVEERPLSRRAHKRHVRLLARFGEPDQRISAARRWLEADPLGRSALIAMADQLARRGDRQGALRTYAAVAEIAPASLKAHRRAARAFLDAGDYAAASGHLRFALDAGDDEDDLVDYLWCLAALRRFDLLSLEAEQLLEKKRKRRLREKIAEILESADSGLLPARFAERVRGVMTVHLELDDPSLDADLAVIDPAGRRISGLWRLGATSRGLADGGEEKLGLGWLLDGTYLVTVARAPGSAPGPIEGRVSIRCRGERRTLRFTLSGAETTVARVRHRTLPPVRICR
ncbi:MAG: VIT domain-containing protein [Polyangia bacterium]